MPRSDARPTVSIAGVDMPVTNGNADYVPTVDPHYLLAGHAAHICEDIKDGTNVLLTGHTGCGKTSVFEQVAARIGQPVTRINMNGQMTVGDFVGLWSVKGGETVWIDGALPMAMREGHWLIIDELDYAEPAMLGALNPVLEPRGKLNLKEKGHEIIRPHDDFRVLATANTVGVMEQYRSLYPGTNVMNEAFLDRWHVYHVDYLAHQQEVALLAGKYPHLPSDMAAQMVRVANMVREAFRKEEVTATFSTRRLLDWTRMTLRYGCPVRGADMTIFGKIGVEDREVIEGVISRVLLGPTPEPPVAKSGSMTRAANVAGADPRPAAPKAGGGRSVR